VFAASVSNPLALKKETAASTSTPKNFIGATPKFSRYKCVGATMSVSSGSAKVVARVKP